LAVPDTGLIAAIIANIWYGVTFFAIMILAALQSVPDELLESASIDGAGKVRSLFQIIIPYIRDTLILTFLLRIIWILNFPDLIYGMTGGGPANQTHIITTLMVVTTRKGDYGQASALGLIVMVILIVFASIYLYLLRERKDKI
jgi:multiple sugar transport system permease protein